jgi:uncharacterized protein (TIGR01777 family)
MSNGRVIIAGGSGFLGQALTRELTGAGYHVMLLTRTPRHRQVREVKWDGRTPGDWMAVVDGARAVVNLTGRSVNCRYTPANRSEILESRIDSVNVIGEAIRQASEKPVVWVQAGSLAIYGDAGDRICDETAPFGTGFSAETCVAWEKAFANSQADQTRKVLLRIGFAIDRGGGALEPLAALVRRYLGGTAGSGKQFISWIHIEDLNRMCRRAIERDDLSGTFNATGPDPVTNREFMREMRGALNRPWSPPVPAWAVHLGARLMGTEAELVLSGRRCVPGRFLDMGFEFRYPSLPGALAEIFSGAGERGTNRA